jgi:hypothetical protein
MADVRSDATDAPADKTTVDTRRIRALVVLELYTVVAYVAAAIIPYLGDRLIRTACPGR